MNSKYVEWNIKMAEHIHYGHQHNNHQEQHEHARLSEQAEEIAKNKNSLLPMRNV